MDWSQALNKVLSLLYWTMLAACTVGPGTVVTCAKAGSEYKLKLIWPLIFASILAYVLLEGTARLTIVSGKSLGECLQLKYSHGRKIWQVGILCWIVVIAVFIGNTLYECNNFAGGMAAIYSLPPAQNTDTLRIISCIVYGIIVLALLFADKVDALGIGLGVVMMGMIALFLVVVITLGFDGVEFAKGLLPLSLPSGSANVVISLIGTTALGFNLFLGGQMAKGKTLGDAQRGICFSTVMTFIVSVLILIVGSGTHGYRKGQFTVEQLAGIVHETAGTGGIWVFGLGFIAAALSSMLTVPLGFALTAESVFSIEDAGVHEAIKLDTDNWNKRDQIDVQENSIDVNEHIVSRPFPKKYSNILMSLMILISICVIAADSPTILIISIAQVFNGCLLPFFSVCLLLCINDPVFMEKRPQAFWANCFLIVGVFITFILTANSIIENFFGWLVVRHYTSDSTFQIMKFSISLIASVVIMILLHCLTDLGKQVRRNSQSTRKVPVSS